MKFYKYHALGNDYMVLDPRDQPLDLAADQIRAICNRHYGVGSDGILLGPLPSAKAPFLLRIFNPDGSEAEKSGNGIRIFCRYLWDHKLVDRRPFRLETKGGLVRCLVLDDGKRVQVEMGRVSFWSKDIPVLGEPREVLDEPITIGEETFRFSGATIGNPHCVIPVQDLSPELAKKYGPSLEIHPLFPNRTNVQFLKVLNQNNIQIEIWERGAGYTSASGSSSSAAAAVARKLGLCDSQITVHMPGGEISISIDEDFGIVMAGPVTRIAEGKLSDEMFE
ncbi:MAG: diaminopimelate epimerase [bacterium]